MPKSTLTPCAPDEPSRLVAVRIPADVYNRAVEEIQKNLTDRTWGAPMNMTQFVIESLCRYLDELKQDESDVYDARNFTLTR